ncbi:MAG: hypothetical protein IT376_16310 [Polyangiaceae bacterium]|nr:hypothetical protein [Polyangiaceae bacterium]
MTLRWTWASIACALASACALGSQLDGEPLGVGGTPPDAGGGAAGAQGGDGAAGAAGLGGGTGASGMGPGGSSAGGSAGAGGAPPTGGAAGTAAGGSGAGGAGAGGSGAGGAGTGGAGTGGAGTGGAGTGGAGTGGAGTGGSGGTAGCGGGDKLCGGLCVQPSPALGCSLADCVACPSLPANATNLHCTGTACDFDCLTGYLKSGSSCVPSGGGGTSGGGSGGTGGGGACVLPCDPSNPAIQFICAAVCIAGQGVGFCFPASTTAGGCCGCVPI